MMNLIYINQDPLHTDEAGRVSIIFSCDDQRLFRNPLLRGLLIIEIDSVISLVVKFAE
jgi:hypothetical protein